MPKVIISGGGTGGHIYPAIAIANALKEINPTIEILFVGAEGKMEMEKVPKAGYQVRSLCVYLRPYRMYPLNARFSIQAVFEAPERPRSRSRKTLPRLAVHALYWPVEHWPRTSTGK